MQMEMKNDLSRSFAIVHHHLIPWFYQIQTSRHFLYREQKSAAQVVIDIGKLADRGNVFFGHYEDMDGCFWRDVIKRDNGIVLIDFLCGNFTRHDLTKNARGHTLRATGAAATLVRAPSFL